MTTPGIPTPSINAMTTELSALAARAKNTRDVTSSEKGTPRTDFAAALKASVEQLNGAQVRAQQLGESFSLGDESVHLSDVMIALQKANIALHTAVQVRNRFVSAYQEIMNMQV
jgi:flagellar hook-basal body complex protein FliE